MVFFADVVVDFLLGVEDFAAFGAHVLSRSGVACDFSAFNPCLIRQVHSFTSTKDKGKDA